MEQLILILIALFVVHPIHPHLELLFPVFDLQHELHASLKDERREGREVLREPLHPLLEVSHEPLQCEVPNAILHTLTGPSHRGHELGWLHGLLQLLLEEVWLYGGDLGHALDGLLQELFLAGLCQLREHLNEDGDCSHERGEVFLLRLPHDLADEEKCCSPKLQVGVGQSQLEHLPQLLLRCHNVVFQRRDAVLEQANGRLA
mmetsp:Transcript_84843/g.181766  ORF Transcript_84843/g.181766 Transcript_84843/m.181766 type:complete len:203 (-) Transcript_84843:621-1229(-)